MEKEDFKKHLINLIWSQDDYLITLHTCHTNIHQCINLVQFNDKETTEVLEKILKKLTFEIGVRFIQLLDEHS